MKLYSFDVFDTILLRNEKCEPFRFFEIADIVSSFFNSKGFDTSQNDVFIARYWSTETTYRFSKQVNGCREGSLEEIYQGICSILKIDQKHSLEALMCEIEYEKHNLTFNHDLWKRIAKEAKKNKAKRILISDIYMQAKYIKEILHYHQPNLVDEYDKLYSSADYTVSKASGHLFDIATKDFRIQPQKCLHMGDNLTTDFKNPKKKGWNADYLPIDKERQHKINANLIQFSKYLEKDNIVIPHIQRSLQMVKNEK